MQALWPSLTYLALWIRDWWSNRVFTSLSAHAPLPSIHATLSGYLLPVWNFPQLHKTFAGLSTLHTLRSFCVGCLRYEVLRQNLKDPSSSVIVLKSVLYRIISISESLPLQWGKKKYSIGLLSWSAKYKRLNYLHAYKLTSPDIFHGLSEDGWFSLHQAPKSQFCQDTIWWMEKETNIEIRNCFGLCYYVSMEL